VSSVLGRCSCLVALPAVMLAVLALGARPAFAASGVPYTDPRAVGSIGLCNAAGQSVTKGGINDVPFVAKAIDSTPAPAPYNGTGATATLFIYQPRDGVQPSGWYGEQIGASNPSTTPQHPTTTLSAGDGPLAAALGDYPPKWDGLMQLRIYLGAPNEPGYTSSYDATTIKIAGNTWQVVQGASVPCGDGQAVSLEQSLGSAFPEITATSSQSAGGGAATTAGGKSSGATAKPGASTSASGALGTSGGVGGSAGASSGVGGSAPDQAAISSNPPGIANAANTSSGGSGGGPGAVMWILIVVGVVGVGAAGVLWQRSKPVGTRRR
jgi:hypothetical protein